MSNEISVNASVSVSKNNASANRSVAKTLNMDGDVIAHGVQAIGTTEESITVNADIGTYGYVLLHNMDSTNYIEIGTVTSQLGLKLKAGEIALFRCNNNDVFAKANSAECKLEYLLIED